MEPLHVLTVYAHLFSAKHADRDNQIHTYTHTDRQTDRQTVGQTDRQRQTETDMRRHNAGILTDRLRKAQEHACIKKSDEKREKDKK